MQRQDLPPLMIGIFAVLFILLAVFYPWLSQMLGVERARPEYRVKAVLMGLVLGAIWSLWYFNADI